jgi:hypothetical protein
VFYRSAPVILTLALAHKDGEKANSRLARMTPCEWSIEQGRPSHPGLGHRPYRDLAALLLIPILFDMGLRRVRLRLNRLLAIALREMGMVRGFLVCAGFMVLGRFFVMPRGVLVMFGGFLVMGCGLF